MKLPFEVKVEDAVPPKIALLEVRIPEKSAVPVALVKKRLLVVKAVEDAYGNCEAATVEEAKNTPWVRMEVVVAAVLVPKELREVKG